MIQTLDDKDDLASVIDECMKMLDGNIDLLNDIEYTLESEKEDAVITDLTRHDLVSMAHEVADSSRIKRAESDFAKRFFEPKA